ncbi:MAG: hypothetical protein L7F77_12100 [Candidatus Magnetominusculus sp. LBB02]|nr:hypothetical protein [Candidatus Magnetominusculus sp. LBB02]
MLLNKYEIVDESNQTLGQVIAYDRAGAALQLKSRMPKLYNAVTLRFIEKINI